MPFALSSQDRLEISGPRGLCWWQPSSDATHCTNHRRGVWLRVLPFPSNEVYIYEFYVIDCHYLTAHNQLHGPPVELSLWSLHSLLRSRKSHTPPQTLITINICNIDYCKYICAWLRVQNSATGNHPRDDNCAYPIRPDTSRTQAGHSLHLKHFWGWWMVRGRTGRGLHSQLKSMILHDEVTSWFNFF